MGKKYLKIADSLEQQIIEETLTIGNKLPSVRSLANELNVSIGTVQNAYGLLEDKSLIESKDRSGYYVCASKKIDIETPGVESFESTPEDINVVETAIKVMKYTKTDAKYQLGSAIPNIEARAIKQMQSSLRKFAHYTPNSYEGPQGYQPLRKEIAKRSLRTGKTYRTDDLVITSGCQESLSISLQATTNVGDLIAIESPCYYGMLQALEILGRRVIEIPLCPDKGMDLNYLEAMVKQHNVKAIMLNPNYSNPTGYTYNYKQKVFINSLIEKYDIPLIEDDVFSELGRVESRPPTIHSLNNNGQVLLCSSFSKSISQDLRVGWIEPGRYFEKVRNYKYATTLGTSSLQQYALADFLSTANYERHLRYIGIDYYKRRNIFLEAVKEFFPDGTKASQPEGGYLCWIKIPSDINSLELYYKAKQNSIGITPGSLFSQSDRYKKYIRLNYGCINKERIPEAIEALSKLI